MSPQQAGTSTRSQLSKIALGSVVGTAIEWYDFFLYGTVSALVLGQQFFPEFSPAAGTIAAFGTFAAGYVARPVGAVLFGHLGDRIGRKPILFITLLMMGIASTLIGLTPTYASIGIAAPVILVALRLVQGLGVGGEWGGAVLVAVEDAPRNRRALFGTLPQLGVPLGLLASTGVLGIVSRLPEDVFNSWGWRIPFLLSAVLVAIALIIRTRLPETNAFTQSRHKRQRLPLLAALRRYPRNLLTALGTRFATDITFNVANVFALSYATAHLGLSRQLMLDAITIASAVELLTLPIFGLLADRFGKRRIFLVGCVFVAAYGFMFFAMLNTGATGWVIVGYIGTLALSQACVYGVQASLFAELFPANIRYTGASLPYQFAGILTSAPTPLIAAALFNSSGSVWPIAVYIAVTAAISFVAAALMRTVSTTSDSVSPSPTGRRSA
ncbi:MFS transporter [Microlunatus soli]|uniref:Putative proline/betaine transporter n=1 Tax=Microlunatus soli TaxID=630515 RepID=A0A1H1UXB1_9ACTN|nr:MFS transporter [Microlunatus soli]SDS77204.1 metabolite-proton symporter [Microlunatus soli]